MTFPAKRFTAATATLLLGMAGNAFATEPPAAAPLACAEAPAKKGRAAERLDGAALMLVATELEKQGGADFHLKYAKPAILCVADTFQAGGTTVTAAYSPWQKGLSTLLYRLTFARADGPGEILVLYSGTASLLAGGGLMFHVSEERQGVISWYAMFREEPSLADVKALAERIVQHRAKPLLAVRWPAGAKEGEIVAADGDRLQ